MASVQLSGWGLDWAAVITAQKSDEDPAPAHGEEALAMFSGQAEGGVSFFDLLLVAYSMVGLKREY